MGETERMTMTRQNQNQRRVRPTSSLSDGPMPGRESRRLAEPLDESGAPLGDAGVPSSRGVEEAIRVRAYERYLQRQGRPGSPETDWLEAEREVRSTMWSAKDRPRNLST